MKDQPKRTEGGELEEKIEVAEVIGQDYSIHGPQKKDEHREETVPSRYFDLKVFFVILQVGQGLPDDHRADQGDDQDQKERQAVAVKDRVTGIRLRKIEMDKDQQQDLNPGEQLDQPMPMRKTIIKEQQKQGKRAGVDQGRRFQRPQRFRDKEKGTWGIMNRAPSPKRIPVEITPKD